MLRTRRKRKTSREKIKDARKEKRETREKEEEKNQNCIRSGSGSVREITFLREGLG